MRTRISQAIIDAMTVQPWRDWYHGTTNMYGDWLRGDPRGWRDHKHHRHVEGDYRNPPAEGLHDRIYEHSKKIMKRDPVKLEVDARAAVLSAFVEKLLEKGVQVRIAALDARHLHSLICVADHNPKHWVGLAKKNGAWAYKELHPGYSGGIWARGGRNEPIADYNHYRRTVNYILRHAEKGAAVWVHPRYRGV